METPRDEQLAADLRALRPTPRPEFAAELDERAAAGFPRRSRLPRLALARLQGLQPRRLLVPAGAVAVLAITVVTVVTVSSESGDNAQPLSKDSGSSPAFTEGGGSAAQAEPARPPGRPEGAAEEASAASSGGSSSSAEAEAMSSPVEPGAQIQRQSLGAKPGVQDRAVERNAELVLGADPADIGDDAAEVFEAVHAHDGIVLRSSTREGEAGVAAARFELLVPSGK